MTVSQTTFLRVLTLAASLLATSHAWGGPLEGLLGRGQNQSIKLSVDGRNRNYILHTPAAAPSGAMPLIVMLHGGHGSDGNAQRSFGFDAYADARGFAVAYGDGYRASWADGRGTTPAEEAGVDDKKFLSALVADAASRLAIDPARVYLAGMSNGGIMTYRMACETSGPFRGYAMVAASIAEPIAPSCAPRPGLPVLTINGVEDSLVPETGGDCCGGGPILGQGGRVVSFDTSAEILRTAAGCTDTPVIEQLPPAVADGTSVQKRSYHCAGSARLVVYRVNGMGHSWPPRSPRLPGSGAPSSNIDATAQIVEFFLGRP
ncbi:MAG: PHB depolymerase family esterase [Stagnimonas sp.]|nr:PHB depolymerase family esterase [Stagnimonas sp.]